MSTAMIVIVSVIAWVVALVFALGLCRAAKAGDEIELSVVDRVEADLRLMARGMATPPTRGKGRAA